MLELQASSKNFAVSVIQVIDGPAHLFLGPFKREKREAEVVWNNGQHLARIRRLYEIKRKY